MTTGHGRAFICVCERVSVCESVCFICWTAEEEECVRRTDEAGLLHEDAQPTIDGFIDHFDSFCPSAALEHQKTRETGGCWANIS